MPGLDRGVFLLKVITKFRASRREDYCQQSKFCNDCLTFTPAFFTWLCVNKILSTTTSIWLWRILRANGQAGAKHSNLWNTRVSCSYMYQPSFYWVIMQHLFNKNLFSHRSQSIFNQIKPSTKIKLWADVRVYDSNHVMFHNFVPTPRSPNYKPAKLPCLV